MTDFFDPVILTAAILVVGVFFFTFAVRERDLPRPEPVSPTKHLDDRKATIYENLRDLQFEYRLGKLSDQDYQQTKQDLQRELAVVLAEIDKVPLVQAKPRDENLCPHCGAKFPRPMRFCGECGKPMEGA